MGRKEEIFKLINFACLVIFIVQALQLVIQYRNPEFTTTSVEYRRLEDIEFPILFKVCLNPGFSSEKLSQHGYSDLVGYFHGKHSKISSVIGWTGHSANVSLTRKGDISRFETNVFQTIFSELFKEISALENTSLLFDEVYIRDGNQNKILVDKDSLEFRYKQQSQH